MLYDGKCTNGENVFIVSEFQEKKKQSKFCTTLSCLENKIRIDFTWIELICSQLKYMCDKCFFPSSSSSYSESFSPKTPPEQLFPRPVENPLNFLFSTVIIDLLGFSQMLTKKIEIWILRKELWNFFFKRSQMVKQIQRMGWFRNEIRNMK